MDKIRGFDPQRIQPTPSVAPVRSAGVAPHRVGRIDEATLSVQGRSLAQIQNAVRQSSEIRLDRIADLQRRVAAGTYHVPTTQLADKMLGLM